MTYSIWKENLQIEGYQEVGLPIGSKILSIGLQHEKPMMWYLADTGQHETQKYPVYMFGTGHDLLNLDQRRFLGTLLLMGGDLVVHVFIDEG